MPGSGAQDVWVPYAEELCCELEAALVLGKPWVQVDAERSVDLLAAPMVQRRNDDEFCSLVQLPRDRPCVIGCN